MHSNYVNCTPFLFEMVFKNSSHQEQLLLGKRNAIEKCNGNRHQVYNVVYLFVHLSVAISLFNNDVVKWLILFYTTMFFIVCFSPTLLINILIRLSEIVRMFWLTLYCLNFLKFVIKSELRGCRFWNIIQFHVKTWNVTKFRLNIEPTRGQTNVNFRTLIVLILIVGNWGSF